MSVIQSDTPPLVSCLCITQASRWGMLQRAIFEFTQQSYTNKELIIVAGHEFASAVQSWVMSQFPKTDFIHVVGRLVRNPGEALLHAMARASGEYLAIWDDDNQNAPTRLERQMESQRMYEVSHRATLTALEDTMYFFHDTRELYMVRHQTPAGAPDRRCAVSSIMGPRDAWPEIHPTHRPSPINEMVRTITGKGRLAVCSGMMGQFMVGVRGDNLRGYDVIRDMATRAPGTRSKSWLLANRSHVDEVLEWYRWDAGPVIVHGSDAIAFEWEPAKDRLWPEDLYPIGQPTDGVVRIQER